jgi:hypothetical protein
VWGLELLVYEALSYEALRVYNLVLMQDPLDAKVLSEAPSKQIHEYLHFGV